MSGTTTKKLADIFRAVLELPETNSVAHIEQGNCEKWDSVSHMLLVTGIESEFGIEIDPDSSIAMTSFAAFEKFLNEITSGGNAAT